MTQSERKESAYYRVLNHALLHLIQPTDVEVLDIGCAAGYLGEAIKVKTGGLVSGVELISEAAEEAKARLDQVVCANIEADTLPFHDQQFDAVVFGDVLEHMLDPWRVVRKTATLLKPSGSIYASIPNVGHITIIEQLLKGTWTYAESGLLDKTHFRFFTKEEIRKLFEENGFSIESITQLMNTGEREDQLIKGLRSLATAFQIPVDDLQERATAYQYIVHARKKG
ncbi:class I SAM-dependent methyltransferase [Alkalihalobacillus sp. LMS6]|uniref:class I SAM-dependent methyltransferase n=1 Tax=Alkalihalobacillus sp. LMS6 TaxID=2924034 RepID=UPI0020D03E93|nr:class I SAM-dependent methyltransferase [Alkalihalobacillus sp. LMS6]UTR07378.1 class I SAM-dependent methyltransferase [Alkalihalobacillus sp. LMS6]